MYPLCMLADPKEKKNDGQNSICSVLQIPKVFFCFILFVLERNELERVMASFYLVQRNGGSYFGIQNSE